MLEEGRHTFIALCVVCFVWRAALQTERALQELVEAESSLQSVCVAEQAPLTAAVISANF